LCGDMGVGLAGFPRICGFVRRHGGRVGRIPPHLWLCAERWRPRWPGFRQAALTSSLAENRSGMSARIHATIQPTSMAASARYIGEIRPAGT
jgi:hypothetical protein